MTRMGEGPWLRVTGLRRAAALCLCLAAALAAGPLAACVGGGSLSLGAGASAFNASSEHVTSGSGGAYEFSLGWRSNLLPVFSLDSLVTGSSRGSATLPVPSSGYPADAASFSLLATGLRLDLLAPARSRWSPWLGIGIGLASLDWKNYAYSEGTVAPLLSVGADVELVSGLMLRGRLSKLLGGSTGNVSYGAGSIGLVWEFGRAPGHRRPETWKTLAPTPPAGETEPSAEPGPSTTLKPPAG
jgi:hypothetical protein